MQHRMAAKDDGRALAIETACPFGNRGARVLKGIDQFHCMWFEKATDVRHYSIKTFLRESLRRIDHGYTWIPTVVGLVLQ